MFDTKRHPRGAMSCTRAATATAPKANAHASRRKRSLSSQAACERWDGARLLPCTPPMTMVAPIPSHATQRTKHGSYTRQLPYDGYNATVTTQQAQHDSYNTKRQLQLHATVAARELQVDCLNTKPTNATANLPVLRPVISVGRSVDLKGRSVDLKGRSMRHPH